MITSKFMFHLSINFTYEADTSLPDLVYAYELLVERFNLHRKVY